MSRVLLVGCDPAAHYCVLRAATRRGFSVESCRSIDEARAAFETAPFAAIVVDADRLRRRSPGNGALASAIQGLPHVIVVCGLHRLNDFANAGVFATLTTPFTVVDVDRVFGKLAHPIGMTSRDALENSDDVNLGAAFEQAVDRQLAAWGEAQPAEVYEFFVHALERPLIQRMLDLTHGNQVVTALRLGLNRNTLRKKLKYLGLLKARTP